MRILFILPELKIGGAENQFIRLAEGLRQRGHDARILCTFVEGSYAPLAREKKIPLQVLGASGWGPSLMNQLSQVFLETEFDVVHTCVFSLHAFVGVPARKAGVPVILSSRRGLELAQPLKLLWLEKAGNLFVDHVIANADAVREHFKKRENLPCSKISTIHNGIDLSEFQPGTGRQSIRQEFNISQDAPLAGTIANFSEYKGYPYLLETANLVLKEMPAGRFLLVGDGPLLEKMKELVQELEHGNRIIFTGSRRDVSNLLDALDVFVFASFSEGLPNVVMEAMAMQKPIVSTPAGGVPELIEHEVTGLLVPFRDSKSMADSVLSLLNDPEKARRLGSAARAKVGADFTVERMVKSHECAYQTLLRKKVTCSNQPNMSSPKSFVGDLKDARFPPETCGNDTPPTAEGTIQYLPPRKCGNDTPPTVKSPINRQGGF